MKTSRTLSVPISTKHRTLEQKLRRLVRRSCALERRRRVANHRRMQPFWMICACTLMLSFLVMFSVRAQAGATPIATFEQANSAFAAGHYADAIHGYEDIITRQGYSAPVLFNLANAHYRAGQFGAAILNYERARLLAPRDKAIAANLRLAREKAGMPAPTLNPFQKAARSQGVNTLAWVGSSALVLMLASIVASRLLRFRSRGRARTFAASAGAIFLLTAGAFAVRWPEFNDAVVVQQRAAARIAPAGNAAESFALKAGETVSIRRTHGSFALVSTSDRRTGWVSLAEIGRLFAAAPIAHL